MKFAAFSLALVLSTAAGGGLEGGRPPCLYEQYEPYVGPVPGTDWEPAEPLITIGQTCNGYTPPGIPDGMGAHRFGNTVRVFVNHELRATAGDPYEIPTAKEAINGGRVSFLDINAKSRKLVNAGVAYQLIRSRDGDIVRTNDDLDFSGINRLCSAQLFERGTYGLENDIFFTGEETFGGTEFAVNAQNGQMYAVPWMGRAAWESVTMFDQPNDDHVAILIGDDRGGAPLLLYVGEKLAGNFLERNGLAYGHLYVWVADDRTTSANDFLGTGTNKDGHFIKIEHYQPMMAGGNGFDDEGFADQITQDALAQAAGAFKFSRPEDVSTNPENGLQAALHSTGRSSLFANEKWGQTLLVEVNFDNFSPGSAIPASITLTYDGNDFEDFGIRSPDNGVWASDGIVYVQEDRSFSEFCKTSGNETSIWALDPDDPMNPERIYQVNRGVTLPPDQYDCDPEDCGDWETSGIIDVTDLFDDHGCSTLLLANAQAHSVRSSEDCGDGLVIDGENLVQGGQVFFLCKKA